MEKRSYHAKVPTSFRTDVNGYPLGTINIPVMRIEDLNLGTGIKSILSMLLGVGRIQGAIHGTKTARMSNRSAVNPEQRY